MKLTLPLLILFGLLSYSYAEDKKTLETLPDGKWQEAHVASGINENGYFEVEPSYSFMFTRSFGLTGGLNFMFGNADNDFFNNITGEYERRILDVKTLLFRPSVRFRFPIAYQNKDELFALNIEPGLYIPLGSEKYSPNLISEKLGNKKMDWCHISLKTYVTLDLCPVFLSIGYSVSDFSHEVDQYRLTHTGFIQIGYAF